MAQRTVHVVSQLTARPGHEDALREVLVALVEPSRRDRGCLRFELWQRADDPARFAFAEEWASDEALDAHLASPHFARAAKGVEPHLVAPPDIVRYARLA